MAVERNVQTAAYLADGAITGKRVVVAGTDPQEVKQAAVAGTAIPWGVARVDADDGEGVDVHVGGTVKVEAGAAVTRGVEVSYDANGKVIAAVTGGTKWVVGMAETAATAAGQYVEVRLGTPYLKP